MFKSLVFENQSKFTNHLWLYFLLVFSVNFIFKITDLSFASFNYDEIISVQSASLDFGHIKHVSEWDNNPPFYYYCLKIWVKIFSDTEFMVRLLSVVFSSLAGGVVFLIANSYFNKITAFVTSLLFLSSNLLFYYSHDARAYSLVLLLSLLSTFIYFNLKDKTEIKDILLLGLINFLLIYSHYIAGLVLFFQTILMLFYFNKKQKKYFLLSLLVMVLLTLLRFTKKQFLLIMGFNSPKNIFWLKKSDVNYLKEVIVTFFFNEIFSIIFCAIIIVVILFAFLRKEKRATQFYLLYSVLLSFGSILILYVLGKFTPIFLDRYLIFAVPFLFIMVGYGLSFIKNTNITISLAIVFCLFSSFNINFETDKGMDYRGTVKFILSIKEKNDLIIVKTKDIKPLFCYYYDKDFFSMQKKNLSESENIIFCNAWQDVGINVKKYNRIIVIDSFQEYNPNEKEFVLKLTEQKKYYFTTNYFKGVKISFYK